MPKLTPQKATLGQYDATQMTLQQILDIAAGHLLAQGEKSLNPEHLDSCQYKGPNGLTCGAGPFCNKYDKEIEGYLVTDWNNVLGTTLSIEEMDLLNEIQEIHDQVTIDDWPLALAELAENFELNYNY